MIASCAPEMIAEEAAPRIGHCRHVQPSPLLLRQIKVNLPAACQACSQRPSTALTKVSMGVANFRPWTRADEPSAERRRPGGTDLTVPASRRPSSRGYADIRIRATHGWMRRHGEEAPHIAFSAAEKAELGRLAQIIDFRTAGSLIFSQGDEAGFVYLLTAGLVRICHSLRNGERQIVAFHWPGDLFGLAEQARYVNSAETIIPTRVYRFQVAKLEKISPEKSQDPGSIPHQSDA